MVSLDQIFDFSFYKKLLKSKGGNLEEEAEKDNDWTEFIKGCGVSIIGVIIVGAIGANFVYFSKLDTISTDGTSDEETIGTYFPIPNGITAGVLVGKTEKLNGEINGENTFGLYHKGNPGNVTPASIALNKLHIPPTGSDDRGRFPYYEAAFNDHVGVSENFNFGGFLKMRYQWYIRSIAATYIFWRGILQHLFKIMKKLSPVFKLILTLMFLAVFIGGPAMLTMLITNKKRPSSTGFIEMITFSLMAISMTQIRDATQSEDDSKFKSNGIGVFFNVIFFLLADVGMLAMCGTVTGFAMAIQFILTFIPPFGPFLFNFSGMWSAMLDIKQPLVILCVFFCIVFALLHLNIVVFIGMNIIAMLFILVGLNSWRKGVYKSLAGSK